MLKINTKHQQKS